MLVLTRGSCRIFRPDDHDAGNLVSVCSLLIEEETKSKQCSCGTVFSPRSKVAFLLRTLNSGLPRLLWTMKTLRVGSFMSGSLTSISSTGWPRTIRVFWRPLWRSSKRSEEHTSELQSREKLVCRLL